jgi:DNA polymerase III sliding clamp (beta) subunit (PCNA family)
MDQIMKGNTLRILDSLLITAKDGAITLTANDLNIKVDKRVPGEVLLDGLALLPRDDLALLLKMKNDVELAFEDHQCTVKGSRVFKFAVDGNVDDFPSMPDIPEGEPDFAIPENDLLYCLKLKKIIPASGNARFQGLWIDKNNILACDGYRLGKIELVVDSARKFMLPDFVLNYLAKALDKKSSSLVVFYIAERGYVKARSESFEIAFRQYDGDFFSYENLFSPGEAKTVVFQKRALTDAIGFICDIGKSGGKNSLKRKEPVVYTFRDHKLKLVYSADDRHVEEEILFTCPDAGNMDLAIGFNPFYNYEVLSMVDGEQVTMSFEKTRSPSMIRGDKENEKYLLLPA